MSTATVVAAPRGGPTEVLPAVDARTVVLPVVGETSDDRLARLPVGRTVLIGTAQIPALLPGTSRSGATMVAGLLRGLSHEDSARSPAASLPS